MVFRSEHQRVIIFRYEKLSHLIFHERVSNKRAMGTNKKAESKY